MLMLSVTAAAGGPIAKPNDAPSATELVERAVALADQAEASGAAKSYGSVLYRLLEKVDSEGGVKDSTELRYRIRPDEGGLDFDLVEYNGRAPSAKERQSENRRRENLDEDAGGFLLNREITQRYELELEECREYENRPTFVVRFKPKRERLPERSKVDCVLNRSAGKIWIDEEDGALAKVEYNLIEPAKFWLGVLGSVTDLRGAVVYSRVEKGVWLPSKVDMDLAGRLLFSSLGQRIRLRWSDYQKGGT